MSRPITMEDLKTLAPHGANWIFLGILDHQNLMEQYEITEGIRRQMFMAQIAHESDGFHTTKEYHDGSNYEGRLDLGNTEEGDGTRFRGRGLIQLTGRANYQRFSDLSGKNFVGDPLSVARFPYAMLVSVMYWNDRKLNDVADTGDFKKVTRLINGGLNGYESRQMYLNRAQLLNL